MVYKLPKTMKNAFLSPLFEGFWWVKHFLLFFWKNWLPQWCHVTNLWRKRLYSYIIELHYILLVAVVNINMLNAVLICCNMQNVLLIFPEQKEFVNKQNLLKTLYSCYSVFNLDRTRCIYKHTNLSISLSLQDVCTL